jgi:bacteriocin biosynthesis cyclodehydratase domain-containing protein
MQVSAAHATLNGMRPALRTGLLPLWRDKDTVQIGIDPRRAVALSGMSAAADVISLLDGSRDREQVIAQARACGVPPAVTERILLLLAAAGAIVDFPASAVRALPAELRQQLMPELAAASLSRKDGDGGARILAMRAATTILVCGNGRITTAIADLLTSSGLAARCGSAGAIASPGGRGTGSAARARADLTVLVGRQRPEVAAGLQRARAPHLAVSVSEAIGVVGPLVRPGRTACLRCLDLTRAERDPAWPLLLAQLAGRDADPPACGAALATAVAAQATAQVLAFADRAPEAEATANATIELVLPGWQWRRRTWPPHPACTCGASSAVKGPSA